MKVSFSKKQIIVTQLLSIIFAVIQEALKVKVISYQHLTRSIFPMVILAVTILILMIFYAAIIGITLEAKWMNMALICIPFVFYCGLFSAVLPQVSPSRFYLINTRFFTDTFKLWFYQWTGVCAASFIGIGMHKIVKTEMNKIVLENN